MLGRMLRRSTSKGGGIFRGVFMAKHSAALRTIPWRGGKIDTPSNTAYLQRATCISDTTWCIPIHSCKECNIDGTFIANRVFKLGIIYNLVHSAGCYVCHGIGRSLVGIVRCDKICSREKCRAQPLDWNGREISHTAVDVSRMLDPQLTLLTLLQVGGM